MARERENLHYRSQQAIRYCASLKVRIPVQGWEGGSFRCIAQLPGIAWVHSLSSKVIPPFTTI
jgi:hypothetical protein